MATPSSETLTRLSNDGCLSTVTPTQLKSEAQSWSALLARARDARKKHRSEEPFQWSLVQLQNDFFCHFVALGEQLTAYVQSCSGKEVNGVDTLKHVVKDTTAALRFGMVCLSIGQSQEQNESLRHAAQIEAVVVAGMHIKVCQVLSKPDGDSKCRILSAQLLCNLVTCNFETSSAVAKEIQISPSEEVVSSRIMNAMSLSMEKKENAANWVEMLLFAAQESNRDALEAVAAALHNCIASLESERECGSNLSVTCESATDFASNIATNHLLMSTLLRQMLPVDAIKKSMKNDTESLGDGTTEWIVLVIRRICSFGFLSEMYRSANGVRKPDVPDTCSCTPEQVVLLHCVERVVDDELCSSSNQSSYHPLGRKGTLLPCILFLARQASLLSHDLSSESQKLDSPCADATDRVCEQSVRLSILEILASSLGFEGVKEVSQCRTSLGSDTDILQETSRDLGRIVDDLSVKNRGKKARELSMSDREKRLITALVRMLGNLCFQSRQNQDLMRSTLVPFSPVSSDCTAEATSSDTPDRTALHVLLSCTSFSYCCFTLREWAIVAVRNALDSNEKNQSLVEQLEVQQALNSPELQRLGVRVELDRQGKVIVHPEERGRKS